MISGLNIHLTSWAGALTSDGRIRPAAYERATDETVKDALNGVDLNSLLSKGDIKVKFDYPLHSRVVFPLTGPVTLQKFITFVARTYERIYREEEETSTVKAGLADPLWNRSDTNGKYGIWGHDMADLTLSGAHVGDDGVWALGIES